MDRKLFLKKKNPHFNLIFFFANTKTIHTIKAVKKYKSQTLDINRTL